MRKWIKGVLRDGKAAYLLQKTRRTIRKKVAASEKIKVFFLYQNASVWNKTKPVYEAMKKDPRFAPFVLVIPNVDGAFNEAGGWKASGNFSEDEERVLDAYVGGGAYFDLKKAAPDVVFYTRPYDSYLPSQYQSGEVRHYARVAYIPYCFSWEGRKTRLFKIATDWQFICNVSMFFTEQEETRKNARKHFWLSSRLGMRKIYNIGCPSFDSVLAEKGKESAYWPEDRSQYRVMWTPRWTTDELLGGSTFFKYKNRIIERFAKQDDCFLLARPHPMMLSNFIKTGQMTEDEVMHFKETFAQSKSMELDYSASYYETFWSSDVLVTDLSTIVVEYAITQKPIIFCNPNFAMLNDAMLAITDANYCISTWPELVETLTMLRQGEDPKKEQRERLVSTYFDKLGRGSYNIMDAVEKEVRS